MATKRDTKPPKRLHTVALRLDDEMLSELRGLADAETRPLANFLVVLIKEALEGRKKAAEGRK